MKKITLLLLSLITPLVFSQVIVTPVYEGTFDGTTYLQTFNFPTGAQSWAGFANNNVSIYPLSYPNGGQISFKATVATNAEIKFVFEKDLYPNITPSVSSVNVALLATNPANTVYTVAIPANATNTYKSALMYVVTRDVAVSLSEIKLIKFDTNGTTQLKVDFPIYDGTFDGTTYSQTFNFPTGAQSWAGFANNNTAIYPLSFTNGGKVSFKATVATNAEIKFVFEKDLYPNVTPSVSTANVALLATNPANTSYEVAIPANATNTYKSALMYVITRDVAVSLSEIKIHTNAATVAPTAVCAGTSSDALQGSLSNGGYNHKFETLANGDVQITFELLVAGAAGVVAYLWRDPAVGGFQELPMTVTGTTATKVITGLTSGQDISYAVKFVWAAGGFGVTKYFAYKVGNTCATVAPTASCAGTSSDAQQGSLSNGGYNYKFETLTNGDVQITFELLVAGAAGVVAYLWRDPAVGGFQELPMTVTGTTATKVITGLTSGQDISYAVKFVWAAGGFGVTKYFAYKVGDTCALSTNNFDLTSFKTYPNPTKDTWTVTTKNTNISSIQVYDVSGRNVLSLKPNAIEAKIDASSLKTGVYFARINTLNGYGSLKLIKE